MPAEKQTFGEKWSFSTSARKAREQVSEYVIARYRKGGASVQQGTFMDAFIGGKSKGAKAKPW